MEMNRGHTRDLGAMEPSPHACSTGGSRAGWGEGSFSGCFSPQGSCFPSSPAPRVPAALPVPLEAGRKRKKGTVRDEQGEIAGLSHSLESSASGQGPPEPPPRDGHAQPVAVRRLPPALAAFHRTAGRLPGGQRSRSESEGVRRAGRPPASCPCCGERAALSGNGTGGGAGHPRGDVSQKELPDRGVALG